MKTLEERFWVKVDRSGECWIWTASDNGANGYGVFTRNKKPVYAHRFSYELAKGPIPEGLVIDHLCRVRKCVNPSHLEAVTQRENSLRGFGPAGVNAARTHCVQGHAFTDENTYWHTKKDRSQPTRHCLACRKVRMDLWNAKAAPARRAARQAAREARAKETE